MKVFFLTEGGANIGFGHITRCIAIQQALEEKNIASEIIVNADSTVEGVLKGLNHRRYDWLSNKEGLLEIIGEGNTVIIDSYLAKSALYNEIAQRVKTAVFLDDLKRIDYPKGIVVNSAIYARDLNYPKTKGLTYLLGTQYLPLRQDFWSVPEKTIRKEIKKILISLGGMDYSQLIRNLGKYLEDRFNIEAVCIDKNNRVSSREFRQLILDCDICISAGGQTIYELARCGTPAIGICLAGNQVLNLKKWQDVGFIDFAGWHNDKNLFKKIEGFISNLTYQERIKRSRLGKRYVDGQGARRAVREIIDVTKK